MPLHRDREATITEHQAGTYMTLSGLYDDAIQSVMRILYIVTLDAQYCWRETV